MSVISIESMGFHARMSQLELRLKESEDERLKLEDKFNQLLRSTKSDESKQLFQLRANYCQLLERDRLRCERNDMILRTLNQIENRTSMLTAKTDRLRLLRQYYETCLNHHCSDWKRSDVNYSNYLGPTNDSLLRPPSPASSIFSSPPVPLFTSTPSTTRCSSLVIPDLDLEFETFKHKIACEVNTSRRKLFNESPGWKTTESSRKKLPDSRFLTESIGIGQVRISEKNEDVVLSNKHQLSLSTVDFEQSTNNDLLQLSLSDDGPSCLVENRRNDSLKVDTTMHKKSYPFKLLLPGKDNNPPSVSIFGENKSTKITPRALTRPLTKSSSFSPASSALKRPDSYFSSERRSTLIRRPTISYRSNITQSPERSLSPVSRISPSPVRNLSKSPLGVVDDIFKKYLINYDKRYLSDPISESKYGKYLYPSRSYERSNNKSTSRSEENPQKCSYPKYKLSKSHLDERELYLSSQENFSSYQHNKFIHEPVHRSVLKSTFSGLDKGTLDSPRSSYYDDDWKNWDHYRDRYEYSPDDDAKSYQSASSQMGSSRYPEYLNRDPVPHICVDSVDSNYLDGKDRYYKTFDYEKAKYPDSSVVQQRLYKDDISSSLGGETSNIVQHSSNIKNSTKLLQTPKKVSFSNEFLYDERFGSESESIADETISQDTENTLNKSGIISNISPIESSPSKKNMLENNESSLVFQNEKTYDEYDGKSKFAGTTLIPATKNEEKWPRSSVDGNGQLTESIPNLQEFSGMSIANEVTENQHPKESTADESETDLKIDKESLRDTVTSELPVTDMRDEIKYDLSKLAISNNNQSSNPGVLDESEAVDSEGYVKESNFQTVKHGELLYKQGDVGDQTNIQEKNGSSPSLKNYLSKDHPNENTYSDGNKDSIYQNEGMIDSGKVLTSCEEKNRTQNVIYGDTNTEMSTLQEQDYVDQSYQDQTAYSNDNLQQYNSNFEDTNYGSSQPKYEQQGYADDTYNQQNVSEYNQVQGNYESTDNIPQLHQQPEAYDNQFPDSAYEQRAQYETESYITDYEQPAEKQYQPADYQQEQGYLEKEDHYSPSHYQSEPQREFSTEGYQEYPQQPVQYDDNNQIPVNETKQNFDTAYQKEHQYGYENSDTVYDSTIPPEQYDQYDQQQYNQYEQQPQQYGQQSNEYEGYEQQQQPDHYIKSPKEYSSFEQQPQQYDEPQKVYEGYEKQPRQYDEQKAYAGYEQQPQKYDEQNAYEGYEQKPQQYDEHQKVYDQQQKVYEEYEQQPQQYDEQKMYEGYEPQPKQYDQQQKVYEEYEQQPQQYDEKKVYDGYEQQPQQYDQQYDHQPKEYNEYEQQPQQYIPYEQNQQPYDAQYDQGEPERYVNYEQQQKEIYDSQYQGEPDQYGNYDYGYQQNAADQAYRREDQLPYTEQPQIFDDSSDQRVQEPYESNAQTSFVENTQSSFEGPQQIYGESHGSYQDDQQVLNDPGYSNQDLSKLPQTVGVNQPLPNKPGKTISGIKQDSGAARMTSESAENKTGPNLNRVLESDSESAHIQEPQDVHQDSSDFDFSSGPK